MFENVACANEANNSTFERVASGISEEELRQEAFSDAHDYFSQRYFPNGNESHHFDFLNWRDRKGDQLAKELAIRIFTRQETAPSKILEGLLCVIYRIRNNLFHGEKWAYGIQGQKDNFVHSMAVLMSVVDAIDPRGYRRR